MSQNNKTAGYFLNDFQREHYESCMAELEQIKSMHFTQEFAKAQSARLTKQVKQEEKERRKQKYRD